MSLFFSVLFIRASEILFLFCGIYNSCIECILDEYYDWI